MTNRNDLMRDVAAQRFAYIDIELEADGARAEELTKAAKRHRTGVIASHHFAKPADLSDVQDALESCSASGDVAKVAIRQGGTVAHVIVKRGAPYTLRLAKATAQISLIRALPLVVARTIHLFGFPGVVLRTALQYTIAHRAGLTIDEVVYFRVDDPAGYTVYEAPPRLGTAIAIAYLPTLVLAVLAVLCLAQALTPRTILELPATWITWLQIWLGLAFAAHSLPSYEEAGPVAEQARVGVVKADPVAVFWVIPAQAAALLSRFGGIIPAVAGGLACWWLAAALIH